MSTITTTRIPPTEFNQILQTNLSPETIVALLNERECWYSSQQKPLHANRKYVYPFWKACESCGKPYQTHRPEAAKRNQFCLECLQERRKTPRPHKPMSERKVTLMACPECERQFYLPNAYLEKATTHYCSRECNGKARGREWMKHGWKGPLAVSPEVRKASALKGEKNPAWKGGVTYRKRKGNYANQSIKYVRCPVEFISMARADGYVMEHRLVVAQALGRPLLRTEVVHHKNHDATDNRLANLELFASNRDHKIYEHRGSPAPIWRG